MKMKAYFIAVPLLMLVPSAAFSNDSCDSVQIKASGSSQKLQDLMAQAVEKNCPNLMDAILQKENTKDIYDATPALAANVLASDSKAMQELMHLEHGSKRESEAIKLVQDKFGILVKFGQFLKGKCPDTKKGSPACKARNAFLKCADLVDENLAEGKQGRIRCFGSSLFFGTEDQCQRVKGVIEGIQNNSYNQGNAVPLNRLAGDYAANEVRADQKYKGKYVFVEGIVGEISKDFTNSIYLVLVSPVGLGVHAGLGQIHLSSPNKKTGSRELISVEEKSTKLNKGNAIHATCLVKGMFMGSPVLENCMLE